MESRLFPLCVNKRACVWSKCDVGPGAKTQRRQCGAENTGPLLMFRPGPLQSLLSASHSPFSGSLSLGTTMAVVRRRTISFYVHVLLFLPFTSFYKLLKMSKTDGLCLIIEVLLLETFRHAGNLLRNDSRIGSAG